MASRPIGVSEARDFKAEPLVLAGTLEVEEAEPLARVAGLLAGLAPEAPAE